MAPSVKKDALCIFWVLRAFGIPKGKALRALFILRDVTVKEISHRGNTSAQFVGEYLRGAKSSGNLDRIVGELLFGDPDALME
jgi:hypothetical protein